MDIFSHGLWGGAALGRAGRNTYLLVFGISVLPDLLAEGVMFFLAFVIIWAVGKKPFYPLMAWAIHIAIDIPTHSLELFPTPFLWPISDYRFNGIGWDNAIIMIPNILLLGTVYGFWLYGKKRGRDDTVAFRDSSLLKIPGD